MRKKNKDTRMDKPASSSGVATAPTNETASHTPGPWFRTIDDDDVVVKAGYVYVAKVYGGLSFYKITANARLIAAAPDLLAALKAVSETAGDDCPMCDRGRLRNPQKTHWPECPYGRALTVIAKAEGRQ